MTQFSEKQQEIAKKLSKQPMTIEELREDLDINAKELNEELKKLIDMDLVERKGEKYKLMEYIENKLGEQRNKKEGDYVIRMIVEGTSEDEVGLSKEMDKLEEKVKNEPFKIIEFERSDTHTEEDEEKKTCSEFIEVEMSTPKMSDIIYLVMNYGPSSVEVLEPDTTELKIEELQNILNDVASGVHYYVSIILQQQQAVNRMKQQVKQAQDAGSLNTN